MHIPPRTAGRNTIPAMVKPALAAAALALCAAACPATADEGELVWYTAMNTTESAPLRQRFAERYPGVKLTVLRQPGEKIRTRILTEAHAGKFFWDVVSFNLLDMDALAQEGLLAGYASPQTKSGYPEG